MHQPHKENPHKYILLQFIEKHTYGAWGFTIHRKE